MAGTWRLIKLVAFIYKMDIDAVLCEEEAKYKPGRACTDHNYL